MQPQVKSLTKTKRKSVFFGLVATFLIILPIAIFYATGYRYDFTAPTPALMLTGAFYIIADAPQSEIYLNEELITDMRLFRDAFYIQGVTPGWHRLHVQAPGTHTWVKELNVKPRIVTEAEAFNLPLVPQVRLVPAYTTVAGEAVVFEQSTTTPVFSYIEAANTLIHIATSTATSAYRINTEHTLLRELFAVEASTTAARAAAEAKQEQAFGFATTTITDGEALGTTTVTQGVLTLYESGQELYARAEADNFRQVPFYFCEDHVPALTEDLVEIVDTENILGPEFTESLPAPATTTEQCRTDIRINRQGQTIVDFDFFPYNHNLVIVQLADGIYVTEIDDRAWQNTQPLYLGADLAFIVYRGGVYVKEGDLIFEVLPEVIVTQE